MSNSDFVLRFCGKLSFYSCSSPLRCFATAVVKSHISWFFSPAKQDLKHTKPRPLSMVLPTPECSLPQHLSRSSSGLEEKMYLYHESMNLLWNCYWNILKLWNYSKNLNEKFCIAITEAGKILNSIIRMFNCKRNYYFCLCLLPTTVQSYIPSAHHKWSIQ